MPNFGPRGRGDEEFRDWLLGGNRKRRILEALADPPADGWSAGRLAEAIECGLATVHETFRALRGANLLEEVKPRRYRLPGDTDLADALRALIVVLKVDGVRPVARPPRRR